MKIKIYVLCITWDTFNGPTKRLMAVQAFNRIDAKLKAERALFYSGYEITLYKLGATKLITWNGPYGTSHDWLGGVSWQS